VTVLYERNVGVEQWWNGADREKIKLLGAKPFSQPLRPPYVSHGLKWDQTRTCAARGLRPTTWYVQKMELHHVVSVNVQHMLKCFENKITEFYKLKVIPLL